MCGSLTLLTVVVSFKAKDRVLCSCSRVFSFLCGASFLHHETFYFLFFLLLLFCVFSTLKLLPFISVWLQFSRSLFHRYFCAAFIFSLVLSALFPIHPPQFAYILHPSLWLDLDCAPELFCSALTPGFHISK